MRIAVFGVGAVGGYFGWRLARAGEDVVFIARSDTLRALRDAGLRVDTPDGGSSVQAVHATDDLSQIGSVDAVLLGVKAWQVPDVAEALKPLIGRDTFVVPLQNGVEAPSHLAAALGPEHTFGGMCYIVAYQVGPGHICHAGLEPYVAFGELDNRPSTRGSRLLDTFLRAEVKAEIPGDIHAIMWQKFLFIASLSGVAAITRAPAGILRTVPETRRMVEEVVHEVFAVAKARGIALKPDAAETTMAVIDRLPAAATTSMQRDIMEGRASELSTHSGSVMRLGAEVGQPAPLNSFIYASLLPQELRARGSVEF